MEGPGLGSISPSAHRFETQVEEVDCELGRARLVLGCVVLGVERNLRHNVRCAGKTGIDFMWI